MVRLLASFLGGIFSMLTLGLAAGAVAMGAIFFVSNDRTGTLTITGSRLTDNPSDGFETLPGIFFLGASRTITDSVVR